MCLCNVVLVSTHLIKPSVTSQFLLHQLHTERPSLISPACRASGSPWIFCLDLFSLDLPVWVPDQMTGFFLSPFHLPGYQNLLYMLVCLLCCEAS